MRAPIKQEIKRYTTKTGELSVVFNPHNLPLPPKIADRQVVITDPKGEELFWQAIREHELEEDREAGNEGPVTFHEGTRYYQHTTIHKAPRDWHSIAKTVEMTFAVLVGIGLMSFLGYIVSSAYGSGFGGGGSGMSPPPTNSVWHGQICYRNTAHHPVNASTMPQAAPGVAEAHKADDGRWHIIGIVSGGRVDFTVDTGASATIISQEVAEDLGLHGTYSEGTTTANGHSVAAPVRVGNVRFGGITVHDVVIRVIPNMPGHEGLLGTDILNELGDYGLRNGKFTITSGSHS